MAIKITRKGLKDSVGEKVELTGKFVRMGYCKQTESENKTALFLDLKNDNGVFITDHCWVSFKKEPEIELKSGQEVKITAVVRPYLKDRKIKYRKGRETDLKLNMGLVEAEILAVVQ